MERRMSENRAARYCARVDAHLPTLPSDAAKRAFIANEIEKWMERYANFARTVDSGVDPGDVHAVDYVETIAELHSRKAKYEEPAHV